MRLRGRDAEAASDANRLARRRERRTCFVAEAALSARLLLSHDPAASTGPDDACAAQKEGAQTGRRSTCSSPKAAAPRPSRALRPTAWRLEAPRKIRSKMESAQTLIPCGSIDLKTRRGGDEGSKGEEEDRRVYPLFFALPRNVFLFPLGVLILQPDPSPAPLKQPNYATWIGGDAHASQCQIQLRCGGGMREHPTVQR